MASGAAWVDEVCRSLDLRQVSAWLPWNVREQGEALGHRDEPEGAAGTYVIGLGDDAMRIDVLYVGATGRARARLSRLEDQVKWGMEYGFGALREVIEGEDDHRTMRRIWVKLIRVEEIALFRSTMLSARRLNALGAGRRQLETILLTEHYRRFGLPVPGNRGAHGLFLRDTPPARTLDRPSLVVAA